MIEIEIKNSTKMFYFIGFLVLKTGYNLIDFINNKNSDQKIYV